MMEDKTILFKLQMPVQILEDSQEQLFKKEKVGAKFKILMKELLQFMQTQPSPFQF
jgi:hypothetical protein